MKVVERQLEAIAGAIEESDWKSVSFRDHTAFMVLMVMDVQRHCHSLQVDFVFEV